MNNFLRVATVAHHFSYYCNSEQENSYYVNWLYWNIKQKFSNS